MADGTKKRPASIPIQSVTIQQPVQQTPTFTGQPQAYANNQYPVNAPATNTPATLGLIFGLAGFTLTALSFLFPFCIFSWFLGILGIAFGHAGAKNAIHLGGVGRTQGTFGYIFGYITLALFLIPLVLFVFFVFALDGGWY
tara:strand:- start:60 stop:482 length:423 start_codon:yes stop_codon:yes gene_type:complete